MATVRGKKNPFPNKPKSAGPVFNERTAKPSDHRSLLNYATGNGKGAEAPHTGTTGPMSKTHQKHYGSKY